MRIGLDAALVSGGVSYRAAGVSVYSLELMRHLPLAGGGHHFFAFVPQGAPRASGIEIHNIGFPVDKPWVRIVWEQTVLPGQALARGIELIHGLVNVVPVIARVPRVVTVHDLAFMHHPERFLRSRTAYLQTAVRLSARAAQHIIAVSSSTKGDLVELFGVAEDKISVIYPGKGEQFKPVPEADANAFHAQHTGGRPYLLHVGTLEPRKNIDVLVRAFAAVKAQADLPHALVLAGARGWLYDLIFDLVRRLGLTQDVHFLDFVSPSDLPLWYNCADLFVYPSVYEGFGLPVVEAMACGTPVITTRSSSLIEVAGNGCILVAPGSPEDLQAAIERVLHDEVLRTRLRAAGLARADAFSWAQTAHQTVRVYESLA